VVDAPLAWRANARVSDTHRPNLPIPLLALAGYATGSGMRLLDPLLPMIAADFGIALSISAAIVAAFMLPYGGGQLITGPLGDRMGKQRIASFAVFFYALTVLACAAVTGMTWLLVLRAASGLFAGAVIPLLMAHIGDSVPYEERQGAIGQFLTGMVMAQMITGPISGMIGDAAGWRAAFLILGGYSLVIALVMGVKLGPALWHAPVGRVRNSQGLRIYLNLFARPAGRWLIRAAFFDGFWLFGGAFPFIGSYLIDRFGVSATVSGLVVAGFGVGAFIYTRLAKLLVRRYGEHWLLLVGGSGLAVGLAALVVVPDWHIVIGIQIVMGLVFYMFHGVLQTRATEALPEARGTAVSAFALALFMGQTAGSLFFGFLIALLGFQGAFAAAAVGAAALTWFSHAGPKPVPSGRDMP